MLTKRILQRIRIILNRIRIILHRIRLLTKRMPAPVIAPTICTNTYTNALTRDTCLVTSMDTDTAGFRCPPDTWPVIWEYKRVQLFKVHTEKSFRNLIKSIWNQVVSTIFRLIWIQTDVRLDLNQSENGKYNLISSSFNKISKKCLRVRKTKQHWTVWLLQLGRVFVFGLCVQGINVFPNI